MATRQGTVDFILDQIAAAGAVSARRMFGEYGVYCDGRMVAVVCDDQLYVKLTEDGKSYVGDCEAASPFPGAKPWLLIDGERWDDGAWLSGLIAVTAAATPLPTPKRSKR